MPASELNRSSARPGRGPQGRPVAGAAVGLVLGILVAADLILAGLLRFDSVYVTAIPPAIAVIGFALGWFAPLGRRSSAPQEPEMDVVIETEEPPGRVDSDLR